jgi:Bacteriodetes cell division protein (FtsL-like)
MKKVQDQEMAPPWEDVIEAPQKISSREASAAAAVTIGTATNRTAANGTTTNRTAANGTATIGAATAEATKAKASGRFRWKSPSVLGYQWIMKNIRFFLFLAALAVIYIYNGHYADKVVRDINRTNKELKELQYEYKTLKSEVMFRSKQSELARAVEPFGLKELTLPPYVLTDSTQKNKN